MLPEHMWSPDKSVGPNSITETGALRVSSGTKTGRVPKQKRIVLDEMTENVSIPWFKFYFSLFWSEIRFEFIFQLLLETPLLLKSF